MATNSGEGDSAYESDGTSSIDFTTKSWMTDVTFVIEDKRLYASRSILALFSPVFDAMFMHPFKENTDGEVVLSGKNSENFHEFLQCVYPTSGRSVTKKNVFQLIPLADEYQVASLMKQCGEVFVELMSNGSPKVSAANLVKWYLLVKQHNITDAVSLCVQKLLNDCSMSQISAASESIREKDSLLIFRMDLMEEQTKRLNEVKTKFVKAVLKSCDKNISGFENAMGIILECTFENIPDLTSKGAVYSSHETLFNTSFMLKVTTTESKRYPSYTPSCWLDDKYVSVCVYCDLPDGYTCDVMVALRLSTDKSKMTTATFTNTYTSSCWHDFKEFVELSKFPPGVGTITAYILAKERLKLQTSE